MKISKKKKFAVIVDGVPYYIEKKPHKIQHGYLSKDGRAFRGLDVRLVSLTEYNMEILGVEYE